MFSGANPPRRAELAIGTNPANLNSRLILSAHGEASRQPSVQGQRMRIAVIAGDGIGKDVTAEAVKVLKAVGEAFGRRFDLEHLPWSADHYLKTGETLPANGYQMLREFDAIFVGALGDPRVADNRHARDILLGTRFELDLYVNYRPVRLLADRLSPLKDRGRKDINFVVFRENTEGVYVERRRPLQGRHRRRSRDPGRDQHLQGRAPHHQARVRVREDQRPHQGLHGRQEQRHAAGARAVAARVQGSRGVVSGHHRDAPIHRRARDVPGEGSRAVSGDRHQQPVRRHRHRHRRRAAGRPGHGRVGQHSSREDVALRAGARLGAAAGGQERREPDRRDPVDRADARNAWRARRIEGHRSRGRSVDRRKVRPRRYWWRARHARSRRLDCEEQSSPKH